MCLYPRLVKNKKYTPNQKNNGIIPGITDERTIYVPTGCGNCIECRKQYARGWQIRLQEDIKKHTNGKYITLTFSNEWITKIINGYTEKGKHIQGIKGLEGYTLDNEIATRAVRRWLERHRKKHKASIRHWLVTELGHQGTQNIHLHGIIWTDMNLQEIEQTWQYGWIWKGKRNPNTYELINYVNAKTINYIIKYLTKKDEDHEYYKSKILTSPGIGRNYTASFNSTKNKYNENRPMDTNTTYKTGTGHKIAMPTYWRNKIYTEQQREQLWLEMLNKEERWVCGNKIDISKGYEIYDKTVNYYRKLNKELGYGDRTRNEEQIQYENDRRKIMHQTRINNTKHTDTP